MAAVGDALTAPVDADVVDARGLIVGPGFVDLHSHVHSIAGQRLQAMDGVTTALDLEAGLMPIAEALARAAADGRPLNYGFSASWSQARAYAHLDRVPVADFAASMDLLGTPEWQRASSPAERRRWLSLLEDELGAGALGIGVLMGYAPRSDPDEYLELSRLAAAAHAPTFTHVRELIEADPRTPIDGSEELVPRGRRDRCRHAPQPREQHVAAPHRPRAGPARPQPRGGLPRDGRGLSLRRGQYRDRRVLPRSGEAQGTRDHPELARARRHRRAHRRRGPAARGARDGPRRRVHRDVSSTKPIPSTRAHLDRALAYPDSIVASDAMPISWAAADGRTVYEQRDWPLPSGGHTHPRTAGTFTKSLRLMVLESDTWTWPEAFRRCSFLPARVLDEVSSGMRGKGHLAVGADADIVVLDPATLTDRATYSDPTRPSRGIRYLFVHGTPVVHAGEIVTEALPGRPVRGNV